MSPILFIRCGCDRFTRNRRAVAPWSNSRRTCLQLESVAPSPAATVPLQQASHCYRKRPAPEQQPLTTAEDFARRSLRRQRFAGSSAAPSSEQVLLDDAGGTGTSAAIEKEYLRLTSLPVASNVRPAHVLAKALKLVQAKWRDNASYSYACEQLKSIRQDLTVQHIRDELAVQVGCGAGAWRAGGRQLGCCRI